MSFPALSRRRLLAMVPPAAALLGARAASAADSDLAASQDADSLTVSAGAAPVLRYLTGKLPAGERPPSVEGTCFTHPVYTPAGDVVTDLAPQDHPHHRGVFCAWVQVEGSLAGDWWGWGAKAPKEHRLVVNRARKAKAEGGRVTLALENEWLAELRTVLEERLEIRAARAEAGYVLDYRYRFTIPTDEPVTLGQNPFGGFCYRARPRGELVVTGPAGPVSLPDSVFNRPETNWAASAWYDFTYRQPDGRVSGVAVFDHPDNPRSTWHAVRGIHMLNPCIVAGGPLTIAPGQALQLRYRLLAHDGPADPAVLDRVAASFRK